MCSTPKKENPQKCAKPGQPQKPPQTTSPAQKPGEKQQAPPKK
jgi:hypothetical protein